jgi:hypothetical protein
MARPLQPPGSDVLQLVESAFGQSTRTGGVGAFLVSAVRPGRYSLEVRATPRTGDEPSAAPARPVAPAAGVSGTHWAREEILVAGVDIADLTLVLRPGLTVSGRVVYDSTTLSPPEGPVSQAFRLIPADADPGAPPIGMTTEARIGVAADGTFSATGIAPGRYRLVTPASFLGTVVGASAVASAGDWVLKSAMAGGQDIADGVLDVTDGGSVSDVVVTFTDRPTALSGQVFDQAGRVTADFPIVIFSTDRTTWVPASRRIQIVRPATDGRFRAVGLPAGEYYVAAVTAIEPDQATDPAFLEQLAAVSFTLAIAEGEQKTQDLKLGGG